MPQQLKAIDISAYQHPTGREVIDFVGLKNQGISAVVIKLSESNYYVNPYAVNDVMAAYRAGLLVGGYHFWGGKASGAVPYTEQLSLYRSVLSSLYTAGLPSHTLVHFLDVEDTGRGNLRGDESDGVYAWCYDIWAQETNFTGLVGIYTNLSGHQHLLSPQLLKFGLWQAGWQTVQNPTPAGIWTKLMGWQQLVGEVIPGVPGGEVDTDYFFTDEVGWRSWAGAGVAPNPPAPPDPPTPPPPTPPTLPRLKGELAMGKWATIILADGTEREDVASVAPGGNLVRSWYTDTSSPYTGAGLGQYDEGVSPNGPFLADTEFLYWRQNDPPHGLTLNFGAKTADGIVWKRRRSFDGSFDSGWQATTLREATGKGPKGDPGVPGPPGPPGPPGKDAVFPATVHIVGTLQ